MTRLRAYQSLYFFFFHDPAPTEIYTLSLHDALPICERDDEWHICDQPGQPEEPRNATFRGSSGCPGWSQMRSEEHTSELQSQFHLVCRLLLEKKKKKNTLSTATSTTATNT